MTIACVSELSGSSNSLNDLISLFLFLCLFKVFANVILAHLSLIRSSVRPSVRSFVRSSVLVLFRLAVRPNSVDSISPRHATPRMNYTGRESLLSFLNSLLPSPSLAAAPTPPSTATTSYNPNSCTLSSTTYTHTTCTRAPTHLKRHPISSHTRTNEQTKSRTRTTHDQAEYPCERHPYVTCTAEIGAEEEEEENVADHDDVVIACAQLPHVHAAELQGICNATKVSSVVAPPPPATATGGGGGVCTSQMSERERKQREEWLQQVTRPRC